MMSKRLFDGELPEGPFSTNLLWDRAIAKGRCFGAVHQGLWFDVGAPRQHPQGRGNAWACLKPPLASHRDLRPPHRLHHPAAPRLRRRARGRADRALRRAARPGWPRASSWSPTIARPAPITDAFVRRSGGGLLLPRLVPIGDPELDERIGGALEPLGEGEALPARDRAARTAVPAGAPRPAACRDVDAAEALRLAEDLARTLDQLLIEEVEPARLRDFAAELPDLSLHWQTSLERLGHHSRPMAAPARRARPDRSRRPPQPAARRRRPALADVAAAPASSPPPESPATAPAVAGLLRTVSRLDRRHGRLSRPRSRDGGGGMGLARPA